MLSSFSTDLSKSHSQLSGWRRAKSQTSLALMLFSRCGIACRHVAISVPTLTQDTTFTHHPAWTFPSRHCTHPSKFLLASCRLPLLSIRLRKFEYFFVMHYAGVCISTTQTLQRSLPSTESRLLGKVEMATLRMYHETSSRQ
jgi:hypothetical protein